MANLKHFTNGLLRENPSLILVLGVCPALAVTTTAINGAGMGIATTIVLVFSNVLISAFKSFIPEKVRLPAFIIIIASLVTMVEMLMQVIAPDLNKSLGIFVPLIAVNCLILGRAEVFAQKNSVFSSLLDGLGMGIGFTLALFVMGALREILGNGSLFDIRIVSESSRTILLFILPPGAFIIFGYLVAIANRIKKRYY